MTGKRLVNVPCRVVWPKDASAKMLDKLYHRVCEDCGEAFRARHLHLFFKEVEGSAKPDPVVLCPECAAQRGTVHDLVMKVKKSASSDRSQRVRGIAPPLASRRPIVTPGRGPVVAAGTPLLDRIRAASEARKRRKR